MPLQFATGWTLTGAQINRRVSPRGWLASQNFQRTPIDGTNGSQ